VLVPPFRIYRAKLTLFAAATMAFLAYLRWALSLASGRLGAIWGQELARTQRIRVVAPMTAQCPDRTPRLAHPRDHKGRRHGRVHDR